MKFKQLLKLLLSFMLIFPVMFNQNIQAEELDINVLSPYAYLYDLSIISVSQYYDMYKEINNSFEEYLKIYA